jgi:mono/diheme cytochrome c family protein
MQPYTWIIVLLSICATCSVRAQGEDGSAQPSRGEYLFEISGCRHCHTAEDGPALAGGRPLETPFGIFYTPNITVHPDAGIGAWSAEQFVRALRFGVAPDASHYYPAFPFTAYTRMSDADARAIHAYLQSQPVSDRPNREHQLAWYLSWRFAAQVWQWLFFTPGEFEPDAGAGAQTSRGGYIAEALGHCQECHTPRNLLGALQPEMAYAGNADGPEGELVPNITPHPDSGIGDWSRESLETFLQYGELPDGEYTAGSMDAVIQGLGRLSESDRGALIEYLRSLAPIDNTVGN